MFLDLDLEITCEEIFEFSSLFSWERTGIEFSTLFLIFFNIQHIKITTTIVFFLQQKNNLLAHHHMYFCYFLYFYKYIFFIINVKHFFLIITFYINILAKKKSNKIEISYLKKKLEKKKIYQFYQIKIFTFIICSTFHT